MTRRKQQQFWRLNSSHVAPSILRQWQENSDHYGVPECSGNKVLLIAFDLEVDAKKVLQGEPWAFDRHLVALQKYNGSTLTHDLIFSTTSFWVQLHDLPFTLLTTEALLSLGETLGAVTKPKDISEMRGGNFMRVRVAVDITKPLC